MKKLLFLLLCGAAFGQAVRYDLPPVLNSRGVPIANPNISLCTGLATINGTTCSIQAQSVTDITGGTLCAGGSPVTLPNSNVCRATGDALGNAGFWLTPGAYIYCVTAPSTTGQCYNLIVPVGATAGGTATVPIFEKRIFTDQQAGADVCARINASIALASAGQIVDASADTLTSTCALNILPSKGITLIMPPVTITSNTDPAISITASNVTVLCSVPLQCGVTQGTVNQNAVNIAAGVSNVTLSGLNLSATANFATETLMETNLTHGDPVYGSGTTGSHITGVVIEKCQINNGNNGILLFYTDRSRITNNRFETPAQANPGLAQMFIVGASSFNAISNNTFNDTLGIANAVYIRGSGVANESPAQNAVTGNTINGIYQFEAINLDASYTTVAGNTIKNASNVTNAAGIAVFEPVNGAQPDTASTAHHNSITGNTVQMLGSSHNDAIIIVDNGSTGDLGADDNVISSNVITAVSGHGIGVGVNNLGGTHVGGLRNTVTSNKLDVQQNTKDGITLFTSQESVVSGNNIQATGGASTGNGVNLASSFGSVVTNNDIISWNGGVFTTGAQSYNAIISGNRFRNVGNAIALSAGSVGIQLGQNSYDGVTTKFQTGTNILSGTFDPLVVAEQPVGLFTAGTGIDFCYADSTAHAVLCSFNNGSFTPLVKALGNTSQKAETGADAALLSYTPPAQAGTYRLCVSMAVSAQNTATLGWTATWTDSNGSAQTPTNLALSQTGVAAPALTFTAATNGNYFACQDVDVNNSATAIVVKTTFAGTSIAYKASATVERLQ